MKMKKYLSVSMLFFLAMGCFANMKIEERIQQAMKNRKGVIVFVDLKTDKIMYSHMQKAKEKHPPCSTFKIWNTLIGIEQGYISKPDEEFYKWDGKVRFIPDWNRNLKFIDAFRVSCVPAFQLLASKIGKKSMQVWIDKINYGDKDLSSGIEDFWLPKQGKKALLISPEQQALLIKDLTNQKLPFSKKAFGILQEVMLVKKTVKGTLFGKTGSGKNILEFPNKDIGWFVGYVISDNASYAFACLLKGANSSGKDARAIIEKILIDGQLL